MNVFVSVMSFKSAGRLFQAAGPEYWKPRSPNLVRVLGSSAVSDDLSLYLFPDEEIVETQLLRYCGAWPV